MKITYWYCDLINMLAKFIISIYYFLCSLQIETTKLLFRISFFDF